ncbi:hypothetical protein [Clostridium sp. Marseille-Q2269]|uniref:hypothetical protein n=1 Tax=Clostridium sp. Marseille-Q2269 TaxID=2942205 RepID=UPI0020747DB6|nr:hypothetical protein [Clostridium sp. Marseille-Q2269]
METKGFSQISNILIFDLGLSGNAFLLYAKIQHHVGKKDFRLNRDHIKSISGYGETAFRKAWKELKDKEILIQTKKRIKGKFVYEYILKFKVESKKQNKEEIKNTQVKENPIDSDGNDPVKGQVYIDEVLENKEEIEDKSVELVANETGFNKKESYELLQLTNNDAKKVLEGYKYALSQSNVKNVFNYTKWSIRNNKTLSSASASNNKIDRFNNFEQRNYDFKKLENLLINKVGTYKECLRS